MKVLNKEDQMKFNRKMNAGNSADELNYIPKWSEHVELI